MQHIRTAACLLSFAGPGQAGVGTTSRAEGGTGSASASLAAMSRQLVHARLGEADAQRKLRCPCGHASLTREWHPRMFKHALFF